MLEGARHKKTMGHYIHVARICVSLTTAIAMLIICSVGGRQACAQEPSLEQRQPLELVFADSIVPQDQHEVMFTTGVSYFQHGSLHRASLTQKVEWGISDRLQVSTFAEVLNSFNEPGSRNIGVGDFEIGARYTWSRVGSESTHLAIALRLAFRRAILHAAWAKELLQSLLRLCFLVNSARASTRSSPPMGWNL
jgi:hypothetical protein